MRIVGVKKVIIVIDEIGQKGIAKKKKIDVKFLKKLKTVLHGRNRRSR